MSVAALTFPLAGALAVLAIVLNHLQARLGLIEVALNDGLPPGHQRERSVAASTTFDSASARQTLGPGLHVFLSRTCLACQRLLDELDRRGLDHAGEIHVRFVDRPRPAAYEVATRIGATVHEHQAAATTALGVDPLPHTVAIGAADLVAHDVTPSIAAMIAVARNAGIRA